MVRYGRRTCLFSYALHNLLADIEAIDRDIIGFCYFKNRFIEGEVKTPDCFPVKEYGEFLDSEFSSVELVKDGLFGCGNHLKADGRVLLRHGKGFDYTRLRLVVGGRGMLLPYEQIISRFGTGDDIFHGGGDSRTVEKYCFLPLVCRGGVGG